MPLFIDTTGQPTLGIAICSRCQFKRRLADLVEDGNIPRFYVCKKEISPGCIDVRDPFRLPAPPPDKMTLPFVRPDVPLTVVQVNPLVAPLQTYLASLLVTRGALPGLYEGGWRQATNGQISTYFMFAGMTLAARSFTSAQIQTACAMAIDQMTVGRRQDSAVYANPTLACFPSGKMFFCNIGGTTAGSAPSDAAITTAGEFLSDGSVIWEYTGEEMPASWEWYLIDIDSNLFTKLAPDSNDAYAGVLLSAVLAGGVTAAWLNTASAHPGLTRLQVLGLLASNCISDDITHNLAVTFQHETAPDGMPYNIQFLADNCEAWHGMRALASLYTTVGSTVAASAATSIAATLKTGILALWDPTAARFRAYYDEPDVGALAGELAFVNRLRFGIWPLLHGVLEGDEIATYGVSVERYVPRAFPQVYTPAYDTFVISEYFYAIYAHLDNQLGLTTLEERVTQRLNSPGIIVSDAAISLVAFTTPGATDA